jgi:TPR repeat protein
MQKATAAVRPVSAVEVEQLIARSGTLISQGNIAGARLVLERAAAGRSREALLLLAKTYDPTALAQWRAIGVKPDPDKARDLYRQAAKLGVNDGPEMVALVAQSTLPSLPR